MAFWRLDVLFLHCTGEADFQTKEKVSVSPDMFCFSSTEQKRPLWDNENFRHSHFFCFYRTYFVCKTLTGQFLMCFLFRLFVWQCALASDRTLWERAGTTCNKCWNWTKDSYNKSIDQEHHQKNCKRLEVCCCRDDM